MFHHLMRITSSQKIEVKNEECRENKKERIAVPVSLTSPALHDTSCEYISLILNSLLAHSLEVVLIEDQAQDSR